MWLCKDRAAFDACMLASVSPWLAAPRCPTIQQAPTHSVVNLWSSGLEVLGGRR